MEIIDPAIAIFNIGRSQESLASFKTKLFELRPLTHIKNSVDGHLSAQSYRTRYWECPSSEWSYIANWHRTIARQDWLIDLAVILIEQSDQESMRKALSVARGITQDIKAPYIVILSGTSAGMDEGISKQVHILAYRSLGLFFTSKGPSCEDAMIETLTLISTALGIHTKGEIIVDLKFEYALTALFDGCADEAQIFQAKSCGSGRAMQAANLVTAQYRLVGERNKPSTFLAHISASDNLSLGEIKEMVSILRKELEQDAVCAFSCSHDQSLQDQVQLTVLTKFEEKCKVVANGIADNSPSPILNTKS